MNPYNSDAKCPKCGCTGIRNKFYKKDTFKHFDGGFTIDEMEGKQYYPPYESKVEQDHISRECFNCGYKWDEAPLAEA